jgi:hypothetical protein
MPGWYILSVLMTIMETIEVHIDTVLDIDMTVPEEYP